MKFHTLIKLNKKETINYIIDTIRGRNIRTRNFVVNIIYIILILGNKIKKRNTRYEKAIFEVNTILHLKILTLLTERFGLLLWLRW